MKIIGHVDMHLVNTQNLIMKITGHVGVPWGPPGHPALAPLLARRLPSLSHIFPSSLSLSLPHAADQNKTAHKRKNNTFLFSTLFIFF
jgi:hypothetical protein